MSVNAKMTAIANEIRELNGGTEKLGLDAMAANVRESNDEIALQKELLEQAIAELKGKADPELYKSGYTEGYEKGNFDAVQEMQEMIDTIITGGTGTVETLESNVTSLRRYALDYADFVTIRLPEVTGTANYALANCTSLENVYLPKATSLTQYSFQNCTKLKKLDFPLVRSISNDVFSGCSKLDTLILRSSTMCTLSNVDAFTNTPIAKGTGFVYVPDELVDSYKAATNWSTYAAQIKPISELEV